MSHKTLLAFKKHHFFALKALILIPIGILLAACESTLERTVFDGETMGTTYRITLTTEEPVSAGVKTSLATDFDKKLIYINSLMSTYDPLSEISRFNKLGAGQCQAISAETQAVIDHSRILYAKTEGAFDPTVGPLVNLWGFGPERRINNPPDPELVALASQKTGFHSIKQGCEAGGLLKEKALEIDFSAIAKGFAVDYLSYWLLEEGYGNHLVEIGGEIKALGQAPSGKAWRVAIERPNQLERQLYQVVQLTNASMATSGDYRNFFVADGKRYSHTIDPRTGYPVTHQVASVTVIHPEATMADGWATALNVMGRESGMNLAETEGLAVLMLEYDGDDIVPYASEAFRALF